MTLIKIKVMGVINSGERTMGSFIEVIESSGWKFLEIRRNSGSKLFWPTIVAVPV